jgi:hypothetical protein
MLTLWIMNGVPVPRHLVAPIAWVATPWAIRHRLAAGR